MFLVRSTEGYWDQRGAKGGCHTCSVSSPGLVAAVVVALVVVVLRPDSYLSSLSDSGSAAAAVCVVVVLVVVSTPSWVPAPACCERSTCRRRCPTCPSRKAAAVGARTLSVVVVVAAEASLASRCGR